MRAIYQTFGWGNMGTASAKRQNLFFFWDGSAFILLSHFMKSTQKTPKREIDKAKRLMNDFRERSKDYG